MRELRGANAILTGASRGIGVLIAHALADEGVNLALAARSADALEQVRAEVESKGVRAVSIPTDVADVAQLQALADRARAELGEIDILVNNAGIGGSHHPFEECPLEEIEQVITVNLTAPMLLTRMVLPAMVERNRGHIVNLASLAGLGGFPFQSPYAASKSGLIMFTHVLRAELVDTDVGASSICPGFIDGDGMYADMVRTTGVTAPKVLGVSKIEKVAPAVVKALKKNSSELIVNPLPMRPILTMAKMFPNLSATVMKTLGVTAQARKMADAVKRGNDGGPTQA